MRRSRGSASPCARRSGRSRVARYARPGRGDEASTTSAAAAARAAETPRSETSVGRRHRCRRRVRSRFAGWLKSARTTAARVRCRTSRRRSAPDASRRGSARGRRNSSRPRRAESVASSTPAAASAPGALRVRRAVTRAALRRAHGRPPRVRDRDEDERPPRRMTKTMQASSRIVAATSGERAEDATSGAGRPPRTSPSATTG